MPVAIATFRATASSVEAGRRTILGRPVVPELCRKSADRSARPGASGAGSSASSAATSNVDTALDTGPSCVESSATAPERCRAVSISGAADFGCKGNAVRPDASTPRYAETNADRFGQIRATTPCGGSSASTAAATSAVRRTNAAYVIVPAGDCTAGASGRAEAWSMTRCSSSRAIRLMPVSCRRARLHDPAARHRSAAHRAVRIVPARERAGGAD